MVELRIPPFRFPWGRLVRALISGGLMVALLAVCVGLPHINDATVALLMVLCIFGIAVAWGSAEAMIAAMVGGLGFDYYFLPPQGFNIDAPEHWIALAAFLITAIVTAQLASLSEHRRIEAVDRQIEMEKLYRFVSSMLESSNVETTLTQLAEKLVEIFAADGVALYDNHTGQIVRSGPRGSVVSDHVLREIAANGYPLSDAALGFSLVPIRYGGELGGSIGISGGGLSEHVLSAIASRAGMGLARLQAIEKSTEAEAVRLAEELKAAVLDAMAHEIRNPLNSLKIAATTLLSGHPGSELHKREMLTIIDEEVNRMDRFLDEAVQLARVEASELSLKKEPHNLAPLISAVVEEMGELAVRRPIQVCVPESLPPAECDKDMIVRVLKQLLNNALKYSPADSPLTVSADITGAAIVISVADRGPGVADDERDRIFEKYYRGRAARRGTPGTGLGLASAKCIVQAHGGAIWVTSPAGGGAAFHVSLPVANACYTVGAV